MARVLFALDLGGGYGHLRRCVPIADALAARGHEVVFAARPSAYAGEVLGPRAFRMVPAPVWTGPSDESRPAESWADVLLRTGYARPGVFTRMLRDWLALFAREQPALVFCDFAPTALLAARVAGVPTTDIGSGFSPAPASVPLLPTRPWAGVPAALLARSEAQALAVVNAGLAELGQPTLATLADTLAADRLFLCCFPEFDHYGVRPDAEYYGNDFVLGDGVEPDWPAVAGPRVFAYLRAGSRNFTAVLAALRAMGVAALVHARDLRPQDEAALSGPTLRVSARPVRMGEVLQSCALVLCHSPATAAAALMNARPVVLTPEHVEQAMVEYRLSRQGLAAGLSPGADSAAAQAVLRRALDDAGLAARASGFARHYHGYDPVEARNAIADECDMLMRAIEPLALGSTDR